MHAFILAGGFATRLWPLTEKRAKPLLPLAGTPLISYLVEGISNDIPVTVSTNAAFKDAFEEWQSTLNRDGVDIVIEDTATDDHKLGALGATAQWITQANIDDDLLLLTGDNYCGFPTQEFLNAASPDTTLIAAHDIGSLDRAKQFGVVIVEDSSPQLPATNPILSVSAFQEKPSEPQSTLVNTGCSLLPKSTLPILVEYAKEHPDNVGGIFEELLNRDLSIECFTFSEPWFDIGSFEAYLEATQTLVGDTVQKEGNAHLDNSATSGSVVIGSNSTVQDSDLENVVVFENCTISDCVLRDCIIDKHCHLTGIDLSGKMLREGTELGIMN